MSEQLEDAQLKVGAHVLVQLGSELVTDIEQAVLECVKNAYDADAPGCLIVIDSREIGQRSEIAPSARLARFDESTDTVNAQVTPVPAPIDEVTGEQKTGNWSERLLSYEGSVCIEDGGDGMTSEQLRESWLVVSGSSKRGESGSRKNKTTGLRTPLGDKGLGRLGTMKLGDILVVETSTSSQKPLSTAQFRWADCKVANTVDQIPVHFEILPNPGGFKGTRVKVLGLNDLAEWRRPERVNEITMSLAKLISPFEATSTFPVKITLDGVDRSLLAVTNDVLNRAIAKFEFTFRENEAGSMQLVATASIEKRLLMADATDKQRDRTARLFGKDGGAGFEQWLRAPNRLKGYSSKHIGEKDFPPYIVLERRFDWSTFMLDNGALIATRGLSVAHSTSFI